MKLVLDPRTDTLDRSPVRPRDLTDKLALITGASVGIGLATARELGLRGARVVAASLDEERIARVANDLTEAGVDAHGVACDLARGDGAARLFERVIGEYGPPDILVNCAALRAKLPAIDVTDELWDRVLAVNLRAPVFLSALACREMIKKRGGKIVNIVSILESRAAPSRLPYAVSKAGLSAATRSLALEVAPYNIQVNAVAPGLVATPALEPANETEAQQLLKTISERIPAGRVATAADVADLIGFLCSPNSDYITGQVYYIDGGMTLR